MGEVGIHGNARNLDAPILEGGKTMIVGQNSRRTNKGEINRIKEQPTAAAGHFTLSLSWVDSFGARDKIF